MLNIAIGVILSFIGILIVKYYEENLSELGGLTFKIRVGGLDLFIIGLFIVLKEFDIV